MRNKSAMVHKMLTPKNKLTPFWQGVLLILIVSAIAYLPLVKDLGYLNDDWYLMYDMQVKDPGFFHEIFAIDRPGRAFAMIPLFSMFGFDPLPYNLSAFLFRFLGGVCLFWTLRLLWPAKKFSTLAAALLFTIYPGFLSQPNAIDYQSHILGLFLALLSVALTVKSLFTAERTPRILFMAGSILAGWAYLNQMEYFIGIEAFRFACIFVLMWRPQAESFRQKTVRVVSASIPFFSIAAGFLVWRLFFFESERRATDIGLQFSQLFSDPLTALWWLNYLIQDFFSVTLVAWGLPMYVLAFPLRLRDIMSAFGWAGLAALLVVLGMRQMGENDAEMQAGSERGMRREALVLGLVGIVGGLLPVIFVNRHVTLPDYSRYTLIASVGAVLLLMLIIENISARVVQVTVLSIFAAIAVTTHYGNTTRYVNETAATRNFWWQAAWRAPMIEEGVTLIVSYPGGSLGEDYFIWGPANLIYYPEKQANNPVRIKLPSSILTDDAVLNITTNGGLETPLRRGNYLERDFDNVLVIIQSSPNGCVRFIDGDLPEVSPYDDYRLKLIAPFSRLDRVAVDEPLQTPPELVFGKEPERGWCYTYQKADLARQRGEWDTIPPMLKEALENGYYPNDGLEWMPFLQAFAVTADMEKLRSTTKLVTVDKYVGLQACEIMTDFMKQETLKDEVKDFIEKKVCE